MSETFEDHEGDQEPELIEPKPAPALSTPESIAHAIIDSPYFEYAMLHRQILFVSNVPAEHQMAVCAELTDFLGLTNTVIQDFSKLVGSALSHSLRSEIRGKHQLVKGFPTDVGDFKSGQFIRAGRQVQAECAGDTVRSHIFLVDGDFSHRMFASSQTGSRDYPFVNSVFTRFTPTGLEQHSPRL